MNTNTAKFLFEGISADVVRYLVERNDMDLQGSHLHIPQFGDIRQTGRLLHRPVYRKPGIRL